MATGRLLDAHQHGHDDHLAPLEAFRGSFSPPFRDLQRVYYVIPLVYLGFLLGSDRLRLRIKK